ncbi:SRPBCC family protein [Candidatus Nitrospira bockiana]
MREREGPEEDQKAAQERFFSTLLGAGLTLYGVRRRAMPGLFAAGLGLCLLYGSVPSAWRRRWAARASGMPERGRGHEGERGDDAGAREGAASVRRGIEEGVTIHRCAADLYRFWRDPEHLPSFMPYVEQVTAAGPCLWQWVLKTPAGLTVRWDADLVVDREDRQIRWQAMAPRGVDVASTVEFRPIGPDETEVQLSLDYRPPGGLVATALRAVLGDNPARTVRADLERFKRLMETSDEPVAAPIGS